MTIDGFQTETGVSRETLARLALFADLLSAWQGRINLVAGPSLDDVWRRHMLDSAQILDILPRPTRSVLDIGSGAGFPGLVLAILGVPQVHLVESDGRKAVFLREAARQTAAPVTVHHGRIERLHPFPVDVVTARACAPLARLLELAAPFLTPPAVGVFPKGRRCEDELTAAREKWNMAVERHPSRTDPAATLLMVRDVEPV
ncbi:MAG: 16S rRNA (guanine(527)-N(7))-methyltransferase RsmG [Alphaproteobacteria bacterium]|nr:16S rRNA (guanine(527)-N(7))-methyltransferase RsmG [Alphaproteobacteria bacterium]